MNFTKVQSQVCQTKRQTLTAAAAAGAADDDDEIVRVSRA